MSTELTKIEYLRSKITSLADHIRAKAGKSDAMTFAELEAAVDGISTGSSGGGGSTGGGSSDSGNSGSGTATIENGYTINFYNTDNVLIESHSAKFGMYIDAPLSYEAESWENENGYVNSFPLTVTEDMGETVYNLFAQKAKTYAEQLYTTFNIDSAIYPYVMIRQYEGGTNKGKCYIYFCKGFTKTASDMFSLNEGIGTNLYATVTNANTQEVVGAVCALVSEDGFEFVEKTGSNSTSYSWWYFNTDSKPLSLFSGNAYSLNGVYGSENVKIS